MTSSLTKNNQTLHGVFLSVLDTGVLLRGNSGIGKSEVALGLINRGHQLIADDAVQLQATTQGEVIGSCPAILQNFLEVRGLGILNIRNMFGATAVKRSKILSLIVEMVAMSSKHLSQLDRLRGMHSQQEITGISIPQVTIPVAPGRNLAILVEAAVRNHQLKLSGYDAGDDFQAKQRSLLTAVDNSDA